MPAVMDSVETLRDLFYRPASLRSWEELCGALEGLEGQPLRVALDYAEHHLEGWPGWVRRLDGPRMEAWEGREGLLALGRRASLVMTELDEARTERLRARLEAGHLRELSLCAVKSAPGCFPRLLQARASLDALELLHCEDGTEWHDPRELTLKEVLGSSLARGVRSLTLEGFNLLEDDEGSPPLPSRVRVLRLWALGLHGDRPRRLGGLLESPGLVRLELTGNNLQAEGCKWVSKRRLGQLEALDLGDNGLGPGVMGELGRALGSWAGLRELGLGGNPLEGSGAREAMAWARARGRVLDLSYTKLQGAEAGLFAEGGGGLERLSLYGSGFAALGGAFEGAGWGRLRRLDLGACKLGAGEAELLGASVGLGGLESLCLGRNPLGAAGLAGLLEGEGLRGVKVWELWGCGLGDEGALRLAQGGLSRGVEWWLGGNGIGLEGARALAQSPALLGVRRLEVGGNAWGAEGWGALLGSPHLTPVVREQVQRQATAAGFEGRGGASAGGPPAAHSMDTTWFAVDLDGHVGVFDSGEAGAVPEEAGREARAPQGGQATGEVEKLDDLPARGVRLDLRGTLVPWKEKADALPEHQWSGARLSVLGGVWDLRLVEGEVEEGRIHPMCAVEGEGFVGVGVRLRSLHRAEAHGEWLAMSSFWSDQTSMAKRGLFQYEHLTENWTSGPYGRQAVPTAPIKWEELPAGLRAGLGAVRLPVRFAQARHVQPMSHGPCRSWQSTYTDLEGVTRDIPE